MYPYLSDLFNDLLGTDIQLPMKTFGFFLAMAFISAYVALKADLVRREKAGQFQLRSERIKVEGPMSIREVVIYAVVWGLLGFKLGLIFTDPDLFNNHIEDALFSLAGSPVGLILGLAAGGGWKYYQYKQREKVEEKYETVDAGPSHYLGTIVTIAFVAGIVGSKIAALLEPGSNFWAHPLESLVSFNGLSFYGGLLLAGFLICRYLVRRGFHLLTAMDAFAPALILAYAVGRIGCQMAGDGDWGIPNTAPMPDAIAWLPEWVWSFSYPNNVAMEGDLIPGCTGEYCRELNPPVFPTPLYETIMGLGIFGLLWGLRKKFSFAGQLTGVYLILNGLERFLIEKIRVNSNYNLLGLETTQAELIAMGLMLAGIGVLIYSTRTQRKSLVN